MINSAWISLILVLAGVLYIIWKLRLKNGISFQAALAVLIAAVFAGLVIIDYQFAYGEYKAAYPGAAGIWLVFSAALQSMQNALRTFVLDGSWSELLPSSSADVKVPMFATAVGLSLNVLAPLLTFSAILSLFKELVAKIRVRAMASGSRPLFLFSELNHNTIFLAENIREKFPKANLVYTDVFPEDDEVNYELREKAGRLHAVMLRTDISELNIRKRSALTEYFLLGHDEEENVMQARKLFVKNRGRANTGIYVLAMQKGNALILDSLTASIDIDQQVRHAGSKGWDYEEMKEKLRGGAILRLRRIDIDRQTAWEAVPHIQCIRKAFATQTERGSRKLPVLVLADTYRSFEVIKTLLWYCQSDKFGLKLSIVYDDTGLTNRSQLQGEEDRTVNVKALLENECPDIIRTNHNDIEGEAYYDIEFIRREEFGSMDCRMHLIEAGKASAGEDVRGNDEARRSAKAFGNEFAAQAERILATEAAIVDMAGDGATLEEAASLRTLFERCGSKPEIYAFCADEEELLKNINSERNIVTYKDENYDIRFLGRKRDIYSYDNIRNTAEEALGFSQHVKWIDVEYGDEWPEARETSLKRELINYERHEYFRNSSMSRAMYMRNALADPDKEDMSGGNAAAGGSTGKNAVADVRTKSMSDNERFEAGLKLRPEYECLEHPDKPADRWGCSCAHCLLRRETEHFRWNAYMRTEGYIFSPSGDVNERRPLAMVHGNLVPFNDLSEKDRSKDS